MPEANATSVDKKQGNQMGIRYVLDLDMSSLLTELLLVGLFVLASLLLSVYCFEFLNSHRQIGVCQLLGVCS